MRSQVVCRIIARFNQHHLDHFTLWQFLTWIQRNSEYRVLCTWGWFPIHTIRPSKLALFCLHHNRKCSDLLRSVSHSFPMWVSAQLRLQLCCCTKILAKMAGKKTVGGGIRTSASACLNSWHQMLWDANDSFEFIWSINISWPQVGSKLGQIVSLANDRYDTVDEDWKASDIYEATGLWSVWSAMYYIYIYLYVF